ncbi:hypothetical protein JCM8547_007621 [Rhodosporidiobolus lusitaniae]
MKCKTLEIRWHDKTPIYSTDFHSLPPTQHTKAHHPYAAAQADSVVDQDEAKRIEEKERDREERDKCWRLATCGADNNIRLWLVHPRPAPSAFTTLPTASSSRPDKQKNPDSDPKVEFLATLSQHTGVVNCVRFAPQGEKLASAGDDGNVVIWIPGESMKKMGESDEDKAYEKESWRVAKMIRSQSGQEIYDLAWSPDGERILAGSLDHSATVYDVASGQPLLQITDHTSYVQGVAWDPLEKYIATQSSDRSMHVYQLTNGPTGLAAHAVGKNTRMEVQRRPPSRSNSRNRSLKKTESDPPKDVGGKAASPPLAALVPTASTSKSEEFAVPATRPPMYQRSLSRASDSDRSEASSTAPSSIFSVPPSTGPKPDEITTAMDPPSGIPHHPRPLSSHSRRSSTSGSLPSHSPGLHPSSHGPSSSRPLRSPSPAPLPAVMVPLSPRLNLAASSSVHGNFNESVPIRTDTVRLYSDPASTSFFRRLAWSPDGGLLLTPAGLFEDPYAAVNAQVAASSFSSASAKQPAAGGKKDGSEKEKEKKLASEPKPTVYIYSRSNVSRPPIAHLPGHKTTSVAIRFCPVLWELRGDVGGEEGEEEKGEGEDPSVSVRFSKEGEEVGLEKGKGKAVEGETEKGVKGRSKPRSLFDLPYRMVYAVATMDSVYLYDTQQAGPIAMFAGLHWQPFTDLTWSPDGQTLVVSSQDGYCSIVAFEPGELGTPYGKQPAQSHHAHRPVEHHLHDPHAHHQHHVAPPAPSRTASSSPTKPAEASSSSSAPTAGALPALFAKSVLSTSTDAFPAPSSSSSSTTAAFAGEKREADPPAPTGEDGAPPPAKKVKKRVQPTLVAKLGE